MLIAGGFLLWIRLWIRREHAAARVHSNRAPNRAAAVLGVGIAGVELLSALPYFGAIALIVGSDVSDARKVILLLLYNVVYARPLIGIAAMTALAESDAQRLLTPVTARLMRYWPTLVASLSVVAASHSSPMAVRGWRACEAAINAIEPAGQIGLVWGRCRRLPARGSFARRSLTQRLRRTAWRSPAGACPSTGVSGFTLGSGSGWLERKLG